MVHSVDVARHMGVQAQRMPCGHHFLHLADVGLKTAERTYEKHHFFRVGYKITQPEEA